MFLDELHADTTHPLDYQIFKAREDSIYLGCLYDAWKRAKAGQAEYSIEQVDIANDPDKPDGISPSTGKVWAILKDGKIV